MAQMAPNFGLGQRSGPVSKVEVSVSCRKLAFLDSTSSSDPVCILYLREFGNDKYAEFSRTETIKDTNDPDFVTKFLLEYRFEEQQKLKFLIADIDASSDSIEEKDHLGEFECSLGEIVSAGTTDKPLKTRFPSIQSSIIVRCEEIIACNDVLTVKLCGQKLDNKDTFGKSDPFLVISKCNEDQSFTVVHKTEVVKNDLSPSWREMSIPVSALCNGDVYRSLKVDCYDWDSENVLIGQYDTHDLIGTFTTNVSELSTPNSTFELKNPKKESKKKYKNSGLVKVEHTRMEKDYGFLDYIQAGVQLNFTVAIDFTGSNGKPSDPNSLHFLDNLSFNEYATALMSVGNIIQDYDSDKMFPALGFGAKLPDGKVSHEFFLTMNPSNPFCAGIGGVMQAYQNAIRTVELWGPTNFAPVINHVAKFASAMRDGTNYFVLLIITDGAITDMPQTVQAIIAASALPMSIIIVGVGLADFSAMELLDDELGGKSDHKSTTRDIVQFVPMRDFLATGNNMMIQACLAKAVLAEVPDQFLSYMKKNRMAPPAQKLAPQSLPGPSMPQPTPGM